MEIKIAADDSQSMAQSGDSILRSLQNTDFSYADIVVRESLQNSLDATIKDAENTHVNFYIKNFEAEKLNPYFEKISDELSKQYYGKKQFLAVADKNTSGLTGDYKSDDQDVLDHSNFQKLVFSIGKNQDQDGAGGSWGMGKTSFFRIGAGIIIYYTRIKLENGEYEERLIASLIEDPHKDNRLLKESNRGIAWWGKRDRESDKLFPITDHEKISEFLNVFGMMSYKDDETGTVIIIPYLRNDLTTSDSNVPWNNSFGDAIKMAIQRWYAPRLNNHVYREVTGNSVLICTFNDEPVYPLDTFFGLMQKLYNVAATGKTDNNNIIVKDVVLQRRAFEKSGGLAGRVALIRPDNEDLKMLPPDNLLAPYDYITSQRSESDTPRRILAYARKPGMVVNYDIDGKWTDGVKIDDKNLLAFFVPDSKQIMNSSLQKSGYANLEQYLRKSEKADHAQWFDSVNNTIVQRIIRNTAREIRDSLKNANDDSNVMLADRVARRFGNLIPKGRGTAPKSRSNSKPKGASKKKSAYIKITDIQSKGSNKLQLAFTGHMSKKAVIDLGVQTQTGRVTAKVWAKDFKKLPFPATFKNISLNESSYVNADWDMKNPTYFSLSSEESTDISGFLAVELSSSEYRINISIHEDK